jgi:hypothetical protein
MLGDLQAVVPIVGPPGSGWSAMALSSEPCDELLQSGVWPTGSAGLAASGRLLDECELRRRAARAVVR